MRVVSLRALQIVFCFSAVTVAFCSLATAEDKKPTSDSLFGEEGEYTISVNSSGVSVHREYDKDGKPKDGSGAAGKQPPVKVGGRAFHKQQKEARRKRRREGRR